MLLLLRRASFHTWRQRLDELAFERLVNDGRSTAQGRTTLVSNNWTFTHAFFCRSLINKLKSPSLKNTYKLNPRHTIMAKYYFCGLTPEWMDSSTRQLNKKSLQ